MLTWTIGEGHAPDSVEILRDGIKVGEVPPTQLTWKDTGLALDTSYSYVLRAVAGSMQAMSAEVSVKTKTPPLSAAALGGSWNVTYTIISANLNNAHPGQPLRPYTWTFASTCGLSHACGGKWTIQFNDLPDAHGAFRPLHGKFQGQMRSVGLGFCGSSNNTMDSATATITPSKADVVEGSWQVTRFTGLLQEYFPAENGCSASFLKAKLDAVRKR